MSFPEIESVLASFPPGYSTLLKKIMALTTAPAEADLPALEEVLCELSQSVARSIRGWNSIDGEKEEEEEGSELGDKFKVAVLRKFTTFVALHLLKGEERYGVACWRKVCLQNYADHHLPNLGKDLEVKFLIGNLRLILEILRAKEFSDICEGSRLRNSELLAVLSRGLAIDDPGRPAEETMVFHGEVSSAEGEGRS